MTLVAIISPPNYFYLKVVLLRAHEYTCLASPSTQNKGKRKIAEVSTVKNRL